jgi:hypothetical protein
MSVAGGLERRRQVLLSKRTPSTELSTRGAIMTPEQWKQINDDVTEAMKGFTRAFVTPLGTETSQGEVRLVGTGNYVLNDEKRILLTCEHVARVQPMHYRFLGNDTVLEYVGPSWRMDPHPIDAAQAPISDSAWSAVAHQAVAVPVGKFAQKHQISQQAELLFFRGFAGENEHYAFCVHQTNGSGYCSQETAGTGNAQIFEVFWEPDKILHGGDH